MNQKAAAPCQKPSTRASTEAAGGPFSPSLRPDAMKAQAQAGTANSSNSSSKKPPGSFIAPAQATFAVTVLGSRLRLHPAGSVVHLLVML